MASYKVFDQPRFQQSRVYTFWFRRYAPFDAFGGDTGFRFEGDHRASGSTSPKATSRTYGCLFFTTSEIIYGFSGSSGTTWEGYAPWTSAVPGIRILGEILNKDAKGATAFAKVSLDVAENVQPSVIEFTAATAGGMPLLPGTPDIDTFVKMNFDFTQKGVLAIKGHATGDDFPNLEMFFVTPGGRSALLVDAYTTGGQDSGPVTRLLGSHDDQLIGHCYLSLPLNDRGELISDYRAHQTTMPLGS